MLAKRKKTTSPQFIPNCYLTWEEIRALAGLSDLSFRTYVILRSYMESDCQLGNVRHLPMSTFRTHLKTDGGQGKRKKHPTTGQVQFCFKKLAERGLLNLEKYNPLDKEKMLLFFPLATPYG